MKIWEKNDWLILVAILWAKTNITIECFAMFCVSKCNLWGFIIWFLFLVSDMEWWAKHSHSYVTYGNWELEFDFDTGDYPTCNFIHLKTLLVVMKLLMVLLVQIVTLMEILKLGKVQQLYLWNEFLRSLWTDSTKVIPHQVMFLRFISHWRLNVRTGLCMSLSLPNILASFSGISITQGILVWKSL